MLTDLTTTELKIAKKIVGFLAGKRMTVEQIAKRLRIGVRDARFILTHDVRFERCGYLWRVIDGDERDLPFGN